MRRSSFLLLVLCAAAATPATAQQPPRTERIDITTSEGTLLALDVSADGRSIVTDLFGQLWLLPAGGGAARPLTDAVADTAEDLDPTFSPDGRRIAFRAERAGRRGVWLLDVGTGEATHLVDIPDRWAYAGDPAWSPDGSHLAIARSGAPENGRRFTRIAVVDVATRAIHELAIDDMAGANLRMPAWSPDGRHLAFVRLHHDNDWLNGPGGSIWIVAARGGVPRMLVDSTTRAIVPAWSPDGRQVAFIAPDSVGNYQVFAVTAADSAARVRRMTNHDDLAATRVRWSSDGRQLVYAADGRLHRLELNARTPEIIPFTARLTFERPVRALPPVALPHPGSEQEARGFAGLGIAPDGGTVAMLALGRLWLVTPNAQPRALTDVPHTARYLSWSADGREIAWSAGPFGEQNIFVTDVRSGETRTATELPGSELFPTFSPDGKWLAFVHTAPEARIRIVAARGGVVTDTASTRDLGATSVNWTANATNTPVWSPRADALLQVTGWTSDEYADGQIIHLDGRPPVAVRLPNAPNHLQWTRIGLIWMRHDLLWRAAIDSAGVVGERELLGTAAAKHPAANTNGDVVYVSADGLRVRNAIGRERPLGWPVRYGVPTPAPLLLRNVRIIDGTGARATEPMDIMIERGRISAIADAGTLPFRGRVLDAGGRYAMPGLMDLHAHTYFPQLLPSFLYFGITLVRDQGAGSIAHAAAYRDLIASGALPGPRVSLGGFQYHTDWDGDTETDQGLEPEADSGHVSRAVSIGRAFGADHLKTRTFRRWDINARVIREAHRQGLRVTGHCVQPLPLIAAGIDAKEHAGACRSRGFIGFYSDMLQYEDQNQLLRAAGIGVVPTITYFAFHPALLRDPDMLSADSALTPFMPSRSSFGAILRMTPAMGMRHGRAAQEARVLTARLLRAGVPVATGTDIWQMGIAPHMELQELVAAGLTPLQAIRAGTSAAARIVGVEHDLGTLETGKLADIILLDADPLIDIGNTRRIWQVIKGGQLVERGRIIEQHAATPYR